MGFPTVKTPPRKDTNLQKKKKIGWGLESAISAKGCAVECNGHTSERLSGARSLTYQLPWPGH
jgi:hypothetical protein